jgi:uncharacterized SAM-binding protein YcdF (DUF218 family)
MFIGSSVIFVIFLFQFHQQYVLVQSEPVTGWSISSQGDCAIVLTGGAGRVREGFDLLSQKTIKKLIVSGVKASSSLTEIFPLWVFYPELKEEDIFLERRSETTYGNAQQSLPLVEALNCREVLLITSHLHMYRAYKTFRSVFPLQIELIKVGLPTARRFSLGFWETAIEALKSLFYGYWAYGP